MCMSTIKIGGGLLRQMSQLNKAVKVSINKSLKCIIHGIDVVLMKNGIFSTLRYSSKTACRKALVTKRDWTQLASRLLRGLDPGQDLMTIILNAAYSDVEC